MTDKSRDTHEFHTNRVGTYLATVKKDDKNQWSRSENSQFTSGKIKRNRKLYWWEVFTGIAVLQTGRSLVRFQMVSLEFFIDIILPIALWPWGRLRL